MRPGFLGPAVILAAGVALLGAGLLGCSSGSVSSPAGSSRAGNQTTITSASSSSTIASISTGETTTTSGTASASPEVLDRALAWLEAAPTRVTFGPYIIVYDRFAKVARLTVSPDVKGESLFSGTWWWSGNTDYYFQEGQGAIKHITPEMAMNMRNAAYPEAEFGVAYLAMVRYLFDPYRLLTLSKVVNTTRQADGSWTMDLEVSARDLVGLNISDTELARYTVGSLSAVKTTADVESDGSIHSLSVNFGEEIPEGPNYVFQRTGEVPSLPGTWVNLDKVTFQAALEEGWRASSSDAAKAVDFPVYSLGDSHQGLSLRLIHVEQGLDVLLEYDAVRSGPEASGKATSTTLPAEGYVLFEYSQANIPESEKRYVENKTLIKTTGVGDETYSVYKTAKGAPGRSILVNIGETYISIDRTGGGTADATGELLTAAAALKRVGP